ncbi:MAG TPA: zinc-binding dehydrogenase [Rhodanobacteraceae bacterium]
MREAASLPLAVITAWEGLVDRARVRAGQNVLVQGAGGVGRVVAQLARALGAHVVIRASAARRDAIEALGAIAVDASVTSPEMLSDAHTSGVGFDVVYDTLGGSALDHSFASVRRFGHVVSCLGWGTHALAPLSFRAATYSGVFSLLPMLTGEGRAHHGEILREATRLVERGELVSPVDPRRFFLESAPDAHRAQADGSARGKIVVDVAST